MIQKIKEREREMETVFFRTLFISTKSKGNETGVQNTFEDNFLM